MVATKKKKLAKKGMTMLIMLFSLNSRWLTMSRTVMSGPSISRFRTSSEYVATRLKRTKLLNSSQTSLLGGFSR